MNIEDIITNAYEQFAKFANEVDSDFTQSPQISLQIIEHRNLMS